MQPPSTGRWEPGDTAIAVVMITLNEAHHLEACLDNLRGFAREVFVVDSFSADRTVDIALSYGVRVVQRRFRDFGDQWNFAIRALPITAPWTMKLDPDERLTPALRQSIRDFIAGTNADGATVNRRLHFMGRAMPVSHRSIRIWRTGHGRFTEVAVNEYPVVDGTVVDLDGDLEHLDSPNLHHWLDKQNRYGTSEAVAAFTGARLAFPPRLFGNPLERRMWLKKHFVRVPGRHAALFLYNWLWRGAWRSGRPGYIWARLRSDMMRTIEYKQIEMKLLGEVPVPTEHRIGRPDHRVEQAE